MDGNLVDRLLLVRATGSLDRVLGREDTGRLVLGINERRLFAISGVLEVKQEVRASTEHPARLDTVARDGLVLEDNAGDVNGMRVELGAGRDGVVPGLEAGDRRHDDVEGNLPCGGVLRGRRE